MKQRTPGQTLPDSNTDSNRPVPGNRHNFRANPKGYLVPNCIAAHPRLSPNAKLMWGVIRQMGYQDGYCYATDEELAERIGGSPESVRKLVRELKREVLVEVSQRTGRPSMRFLLWHECFEADVKGGENPGPDSDLYPPGYGEFLQEGGRAKEHGSMSKSARLDEQNSSSYPNYLSSVSSSVLSSNNNSTFPQVQDAGTTPNAPAVAAQKRTGKEARKNQPAEDGRIAELESRGVLGVTARRAIENLPADFPLVDALDFYQAQATAAGSRIRNVPGFVVTMLEGRILPPANWETRAQKAARERAEREQAELDARQMDFDLQLEAELDAAADAKVDELRTAEPQKFAELVKQAKAELLMNPQGAATPAEFRRDPPRFETVARTKVWQSIRQDLYLARITSSPDARSLEL